MTVLEKEIYVNLATQIKYYEELGYTIPRYVDKQGKLRVKQGAQLLIKIEDLYEGSIVKVTRICDDCGDIKKNCPYYRVIISRNKNKDKKDRCRSCARKEFNKHNIPPYEKSLEYHASKNNKKYLLYEFSSRNISTPTNVFQGTTDLYWWNCPRCESEYDMSVNNRMRGGNCPYCSGMRINQTNCLWTTNPNIAEILTDPRIGYEVTANSSKTASFTCSNCGYSAFKRIYNVTNNGFSCPKCGDGISYPEKIMFNLLSLLNVDFERQKSFEWAKDELKENKNLSKNKFYDFYIHDLNCIIEVHGVQHYKENNFGMSFKDVQDNDNFKEKLAKENGIENYIVIDCRFSELGFIRDNILNSKLNKMINLSDVDWELIHKTSLVSVVKTVCNLWSNGIRNASKIAEIVKLCNRTVTKYLKQGAGVGWCDYNALEEMRKNGKRAGKLNPKKFTPVVQLTIYDEFIQEWHSMSEASKVLGVSKDGISAVCRGVQQTSSGFKWMYKIDYDKYKTENANVQKQPNNQK